MQTDMSSAILNGVLASVFARVCTMTHGCTSDIVRQDVSDENVSACARRPMRADVTY